MTSQKEHIQALIAEIDIVLQRTNPRLPWVMSGEVAQQRQVLERVRNFLVALQQTLLTQEGMRQPLDGVQALAAQMGTGGASAPGLGGIPGDMTPYQMMQAILQEVSYLRANLTPATLNQAPPQQSQLTTELLQVLMSRLQENLSHQIAQTLEQLRQQSSYPAPPILSGGMPPVPAPSQYEQLQNLRSRSDQMLVNLDTTLNVVFESLQRNIQAYQEALSQGLERMYSMGQQSEYTFKVLVDQLTQQLKQEASSYLRSSPSGELPAGTSTEPLLSRPTDVFPPSPVEPPRSPNAPVRSVSPPQQPVSPPQQPAARPAFPYAGSELLSSEISGSDLTPPPETFTPDATVTSAATPLDSAIESWLQSVSAMNRDDTPQEDALRTELPSLDLSDLDLGALDVPVAAPPVDLPASPPFDLATPLAPPPAAPPASPSSALPFSPEPASAPPADDDTADIDAVLKLLEELSAEVETSENAASLEDAEAQLEQILSPSTPDGEAQSAGLPEDAREELDEFLQDDFYQSLFGSEAAIAPAPAPTPEPERYPEPEPNLEEMFNLTDVPVADSTISESGVSPGDDILAAFTVNPETSPETNPETESVPDLLFDLPPLSEAEELQPTYLELPADLFDTEPVAAEPLTFAPPSETAPSPDLTLDPVIAETAKPETALTADTPAIALDFSLPDETTSDLNLEFGKIDNAPSSVDFETGETLSTLFQEVTEEATRSVPVDPPVVRYTSPPPPRPVTNEPEALFLGDDLFGRQPAPESGEDQFTRAVPEESLLPDSVLDQNGITLELDDFTLSSLSEDLSSLEDQRPTQALGLPEIPLQEPSGSFEAPVPPASPLPPPATEDDLSLESFAASLSGSAPTTGAAPFYQASPAIADISLEGFADLFGGEMTAAPPADPASPPATPDSPPFAFDGTANLFEESPTPAPPIPTPPPVVESSPFTLEGMDDLFGDAPAIDRGVSLPPIPQPPPGSDPLSSQSVPFTLEGMNDLFENAPPLPPPPVPPSVNSVQQEMPPVPSGSSSGRVVPPPRSIPPFKPELFHPDDVMEPSPDYKLERLDNLFADSTSTATAETAIANESALPDQAALDAAFESLLGTPPTANPQPLPSQSASQKKKTP